MSALHDPALRRLAKDLPQAHHRECAGVDAIAQHRAGADRGKLVDVTDQDNLLAGYWHSDGPNDGADNNSQDDPYTVTVSGGANNTTGDFGYYVQPASIGNQVWEDVNGDGVRGVGEPGLAGVIVTLTITYPDGSASTVVTTTDVSPWRSQQANEPNASTVLP